MRRIDLLYRHAVADAQPQVGKHRITYLAVQAANLRLDVFGFQDIGAGGSRLFGQAVQEAGVDVVFVDHAEGEDTRTGRVFLRNVVQDLVEIGFTDGRLAV